MISKPHFNRFRVGELLQFSVDTISICDKNDPVKLMIADKLNLFRTNAQGLDTAFNMVAGSSLSAEIAALDQRRDSYLTGIRLCADSYTYHFDSNIVNAASILLGSIDKFGRNIPQLNYQAATSTISSIVSSWNNDSKLAGAIDLLKLNDWARELKTANDKFNEVYLSRVEEKSQSPQIDTIEMRKTVIASFRDLTGNIEARATLDTDGIYIPLINQLNTLIDKYNQVVDGRKTSTKDDASATEEVTSTTSTAKTTAASASSKKSS